MLCNSKMPHFSLYSSTFYVCVLLRITSLSSKSRQDKNEEDVSQALLHTNIGLLICYYIL